MSLPNPRCLLLATVLAAGLVPPVAGAAGRGVNERRAADPQGTVEVVNVAGRVEVAGWDRAEVEVTGTLGEGVERLDFTSAGGRTTVKVVLPGGSRWNSDGTADLRIRVPQRSGLVASVVSADLESKGVQGEHQVQSVSGNVVAEIARPSRIKTVSGDVRVTAKAGIGSFDLATVSGDATVAGAGAIGGSVSFQSVSGDARIDLGTVTVGRMKTVSGDLSVTLGLAPDGQLDVDTISGDVGLDFAGLPDARFDVEAMSGDVSACFGPKPVTEEYGPGTRLTFVQGAGNGRVHVDSKSGDVRLCTKK